MILQSGNASPLGATIRNKGVNFSIFSPLATKVELLIFKDENDSHPVVLVLDANNNKSYYYWHVFIEGLGEGTIYAYRIHGPTSEKNKFDSSKILLDPYGKSIVGNLDRELAQQQGVCNIKNCLKNVVISENQFDWGKVNPPQFSNSKNIIYELHPKGFTAKMNSPYAGTFKGMIDKIPYLKSLGINTVELMPIFYFDSQDAPQNRSNYWGYSPINFFSLHSEYCTDKSPLGAINEFKNCIKTFHENNIKVVLDVVYNHTAESDFSGPTYSFKGIANSSYYYINEEGAFLDFTGCGNTLNTNHSVIRRMITDSLRYWKEEFHIDGFRFDLAGVMTRDENGNHTEVPPIIWEIDSDPVLSKSILIAEPWDVKGYHTTNFPGDKWSIWQDHFRDTIRKTVRGDKGMIPEFIARFSSSFDQQKNDYLYYKPQRNINFICCHDGFTMHDLVSYNDKHNQANGENNNDGSNNNLSNNYGVEGATDNPNIQQLRIQQMRNFFTCLILAHGTPMLSMGDEVCRTQLGNNNPYSLDIPENWFDWQLVEQNAEMLKFVQRLIQIRNQYKLFSYKDFFDSEPNETKPYYQLHGIQLKKPDLSYHSHSIAIEYISPKFKERLFLVFNFYTESLEFELPEGQWQEIVSTATQTEAPLSNKIKLGSRSIKVLEKV